MDQKQPTPEIAWREKNTEGNNRTEPIGLANPTLLTVNY